MSKRWIIINVVLFVVTGFISWQLRESVRRFDQENDLNALRPAPHAKLGERHEGELAPLLPPQQYAASTFGSIAAQNLFSDTRTNQPEEPPPQVVEQVPVLKDKPVLLGVMLSGKDAAATILDPGSPQVAGRRRSQTIRLGDVFRGYTVVDITAEQMVLEYGRQREAITLDDSTRQAAKGAKTPLIATRVVNFGKSSPGSTLVAGAPPTPPVPGAPAPVAAVNATPQTAQSGIRSSGQIVPVAAQPGPNVRGVNDQLNRQVVKTPFGDAVYYPP
jgi:hypothetical protein